MVNRRRDWKEQQQNSERDRVGGSAKLRRLSTEGSERSNNPQALRDRRSSRNTNEVPSPSLTVETMMMIKAEQPPPSPSAMTEPLDLPEELPKKDVPENKFALCLSDQILSNAAIGIEYYKKFPEKLREERELQQKRLHELETQIQSLHSEYVKCVSLKTDKDLKLQKAEQSFKAAKEKLTEAEAKYAEIDKSLKEKQNIYLERLQRKESFMQKRLTIEEEYYGKKRDQAGLLLKKLARKLDNSGDETLKKLEENILRLKEDRKTAKENENKFEGVLREAEMELNQQHNDWKTCKTARDNEKSACDGLERSMVYYKGEALKVQEKMNEMHNSICQARLEHVKVEKDLNMFHFIVQSDSLDQKAQMILSDPFAGLRDETAKPAQSSGSLKSENPQIPQ